MRKFVVPFVAAVCGITLFSAGNCEHDKATTAGGIRPIKVRAPTDPSGKTAEQLNVASRVGLEQPGSIKHLYVISAYSGQVIIYSTVRGKVTSSGKRLTPVPSDDGTYGHSIPYLYWWDSQGRYHQHYVSGGQILHISDQPIAVRDVIINLEMVE